MFTRGTVNDSTKLLQTLQRLCTVGTRQDPGPMHHLPRTDLRDPEGFSAAYRMLAPTAHAAAVAVLRGSEAAGDVGEGVFCTLWARAGVYRPERGALTTFVQIMARSRALDRVRSRAARAAALDRDAQEARYRPATAEPSSEEVIRRDSAQAMLRDLDGLPDGQRAAVLLHHIGGLSDGGVARALHVPPGPAQSRLPLRTRRAPPPLQQRLPARAHPPPG